MGRRTQGYAPEAVTVELPSVLVVQGEHATLAVVDFGDGETFVGEAKRCPGDVRDAQIGRDVAVGRALQRYGQYLTRRGVQASYPEVVAP